MDTVSVCYVMRHEPTGKLYVGATHDYNKRKADHYTRLQRGVHPCKPLQALYNQLPNPELFTWELFVCFSFEAALMAKQKLITDYQSTGNLLSSVFGLV